MEGIRVSKYGGPQVMEWTELPDATPGRGEVAIEVTAAGVNFIDTYHRTGSYPVDLPFTPGVEGAGVVAALGEGVDFLDVGDRVAWTSRPGSYATHAVLPATDVVRVPSGITLEEAAAVLLQGITAHYLTNSTWPLDPGDKCLVHAGAGGVGGLLIQMAKRRGAEVFATAGGNKKTSLAAAAGADHVIDYIAQDFVSAVEAIAGPRPLAVIYDGVGAATVERGLALLRPRGLMAAFGNTSGPVAPLDILDLSRHGSLFITRPTTGGYLRTRDERLERTDDLFAWLQDATLQLRVGATYPMREAEAAHTALEGRDTMGKVLLVS